MIEAGMNIGGLACIGIFVLAYIFVLAEEFIHLKKSKPVILAAGLIWIIIGIIAPDFGISQDDVHHAIMKALEEYAALLLFLLVAMTYISTLEERNVFAALRTQLVKSGFSLRQLFWITGILAFFISPVADNMTTALVMGAVVMAVGANDKKFIALGCINIVAAANAGGAFSPFGDITTLMVWQAQKVTFFEFFDLFIPSVLNFAIPAAIMTFAISKEKPAPLKEQTKMKPGARGVIALGILTIIMAVSFENFLGLPPFFGMMIGLSLLMIYGWYIARKITKGDGIFDIFERFLKVEWDTLLFFFGIIFCVSGLGFLGYLAALSETFYDGLGPSTANVLVGFLSAIIDNIPVMYAVLTMDPHMDHFQWLLVTLTAGVGGTLLSIGSAAGVALMGVSKGNYTFFSHLKWTPVLLLGYIVSVASHFFINAHLIGVVNH